MNTNKIDNHLIHRIAMLAILFMAFVSGVNARKYYVIYYDDTSTTPATRHYLSISEDGGSVVDEEVFTNRSIWFAKEQLSTAVGKQGEGLGSSSDDNKTNENNRKSLFSAVYPNKEITDPASGVTEDRVNSGTVFEFRVNNSTTKPRWLIDNEIKNTPIVYRYYRKQYVYYDNGWKFSFKGYETHQSKLATIEEYSFLFPPYISSAVQTNNGCTVSLGVANGDIFYTTDGSIPTSSSTKYESPFNVVKTQKIKAIAIDESKKSIVVDIVLPSSLTVTLDDREDHTWTYYSGINPEVDPSKDHSDENSGYNKKYKGKLHSPNPRDVMITYDGKGGAVSIYEPETKFIYYKTLERGKTEGQYPYTVISNPFSKRPVVNNKVQGFGGWKIVSGHGYIKRANGNMAAENDVLDLDEEIVFVGLPDNTNNPTLIEFNATWVDANITYLDNKTGSVEYTSTETAGTYETNFLVLQCNPTSITLNSPCTIMMVEPDGSNDYRGIYTFTGEVVPYNNTSNNDNGNSKIEYTHWDPIEDINARGRNFTIGRGMTMSATNKPVLYGNYTTSSTVDQILKVESGIFNGFSHYENKKPTSIVKQWITLGCDYDRAGADNNKLDIQGEMLVGRNVNLPTSPTQEICRVYSLSGKFMSTRTVSGGSTTDSYYLRVRSNANKGHVYMEILGGNWKGIAGGWGDTHTASEPAFTFRMRGGLLEGSLYGAAEYYNAAGTRTFVITGGTIKGWVAGGANGTRLTDGAMDGVSYVYVGGNAQINSGGSEKVINRAVGGNVFGAGCGYCDAENSTSGQVTLGTNVVIADNAYVERGVYGGGSFGYCSTDTVSNIYITGGRIGAVAGGVKTKETGKTVNGHAEYSKEYDENIQGGVYGGACQNKGGSVNIYMTGGTVNGGLYGGSNASGALSGNVNMTIAGGNVGSQEKAASVYGGGYGNSTTVNGSTNITMTEGTINGSVFGGGNQGTVGSNATVTITGGEIKQNVYGGGNEAEVKGQTKVVIGE